MTIVTQLRVWRHHEDVMTRKRFPCYWPFVRGIHRQPVDSPDKGPVPATGGFPWQRASDAELWCFFEVSPNKLLSKHSNGRWSETSWRWCVISVTLPAFNHYSAMTDTLQEETTPTQPLHPSPPLDSSELLYKHCIKFYKHLVNEITMNLTYFTINPVDVLTWYRFSLTCGVVLCHRALCCILGIYLSHSQGGTPWDTLI